MQCQQCAQLLPEPTPKFCPTCGAAVAAAPPGQGPELGDNVKQAAQVAKETAAQVAAGIHRTLNDPKLVNRIPGRSVSLAGLALMALAIVLTWLPWLHGIGFFWSTVMLLGGAVVAVQELRSGGVELPWMQKVPVQLFHPLIPPVFSAFVAVQAFQILGVGLVELLWLFAAFLLGYDQYRKTILAPDGFGQYFDLRLAWYGYRRYILLGAALCLLSLFMVWGQSSGWWSGGLSYRYLGNGVSGYEWDFLKYYNPGWSMTGRSQSLAIFVEAALLSLVIWSAYKGDGTVPTWFNYVGLGLAGFLGLWWLVHIKMHLGVWLFFLGLGAIGLAVGMIYRGQHTGEWDVDHLLQRIKALLAGGK